ncbi:MAG: hypothetical protein WEA28_03580 [Xanthobacteraceae bacterium]
MNYAPYTWVQLQRPIAAIPGRHSGSAKGRLPGAHPGMHLGTLIGARNGGICGQVARGADRDASARGQRRARRGPAFVLEDGICRLDLVTRHAVRTPHPDGQIHRAHADQDIISGLDCRRDFLTRSRTPVTHNTHTPTPTLRRNGVRMRAVGNPVKKFLRLTRAYRYRSDHGNKAICLSMILSENRLPPRIKSGAGFFGIIL